MKERIEKAGNSFYQYRACNLSIDTIYDLENIINGVVYARSPLYMNDPFDSMIGFSSEVLYQNFIDMFLSTKTDDFLKSFVGFLLKEKKLGEVAELIHTIKDFQFFLRAQRNTLGMGEPSLSIFAVQQCKKLYRKMNPALKRKIKDINLFCAMAFYTADIDLSEVTEQNLLQMLEIDDMIQTLLDTFEETKEKVYIPQFREFLSQMTVSCFSASGWDNQLMWSHYANSYSGICIEYDFSTVNETTGFVFPVKYSQDRPTITLKDLGFHITEEGNVEQKIDEPDIKVILSYLLTKNKCWEYEKEWRIINIGEKDTPIFIDLPQIKSITIGFKINSVCKHLLIDICRDKKIPCFMLAIDTERFALDRKPIGFDNVEFNTEDEVSFIHHIQAHIIGNLEKLGEIKAEELFDQENHYFNTSKFCLFMELLNDALFHLYCLKKTINNFMRFSDDTVEEKTYDELKESIKQIDWFIEQQETNPDELKKGLLKLKLLGIISADIYQRASALIEAYSSLHEKINRIEWDPRIKPENDD